MDIDSPPITSSNTTTAALNLPTFSSAFPLPFRVLALIGFALLLWAVNLHVLTLLGLDVAWAVDLGAPEVGLVEERECGEREQVDEVLFEYDNNNNNNHQQTTCTTQKPIPAPPLDFSDDLPRPSFDGYGRIVASPGLPGSAGGTTGTVGTRAVFVFPSSRNGSVVSFPGEQEHQWERERDNGRRQGSGGRGVMDHPAFFDTHHPTTIMEDEKNRTRPTAQSVYRSIYALFLVYTLYVSCAWFLYRTMTTPASSEVEDILTQSRTTGGSSTGSQATTTGSGEQLTYAEASGRAERQRMERFRAFVGLAVGGLAVMGFGTGFGFGRWKVGERERRSLLRSLRRILLPPTTHAPFFSDVILADILTSFAKVLGDVYISTCQIWAGGITKGRVRVGGAHDWIVLGMVSLPYMLRLRQCINEYLIPSNTSTRPLANALKYATAFPVIILSAAQRTVVKEVAEQYGVTPEELVKSRGRWFGEHRLFRLWLLAVIVNSMYSFWWDVTNDWGLSVLKVETWVPDHPAGGGGVGLPITTPTTPRGATDPRAPPTMVRVLLGRLYRVLQGIRAIGTTTAAAAAGTPQAGEYELVSAFPGVAGEHQRSPMPSAQQPHLRRRSSFTVPLSPNPSGEPVVGGAEESEDVGGGGGGGARRGTHSRAQSHSSHFHPASLAPVNTHATSSSRWRIGPPGTSRITSWFSALPFRNMPNPLLFGLRQRLLFPDPIVYHLFIALDFILRFTWSLKLSSHLHTIAEIESGVFMMEALELLRRWMWVFLRTEWEVVKKIEAERDAMYERRYRRRRAESVGRTGRGGEVGEKQQVGRNGQF
ncbi:hypothetical protein QFC22_005854 [Naganishia vaughanmartiniae]|uniref:Uncharacterized protein n=1 Tax=Naganishia vaughanmartiniae TaxID=1424756 RepID=A0ACC2WS73_9TREE|nr:hypothetical protein QFC22_005854 [Naganishia vaughanmartiniae]